jgi:hypothetical protein
MTPTRIELRLTVPGSDDENLPTADNTKLTAICQCPTWGILRYNDHKAMPGSGRALALEAGQAMHQVFAAVRLWQLGFVQGHLALMGHHGRRIFGNARWEKMRAWLIADGKPTNDETARVNFVLEALYTSGFYDDPNDTRRTMRNLEECAIAYVNKYEWDRRPVWVRDPHDPASDVGIEIAVDFVITWHYDDGTSFSMRYTGRMDGVHMRGEHEIIIEENKTASRLNDAWSMSFEMSHQITGYVVGMQLWTQQPITDAVVRGITIPLPKSYDYGGIVSHSVKRDTDAIAHWLNWVHFTVRVLWLPNAGSIIQAPRFTHSCNRYFRPCSFIPFCAVPDEEKAEVLAQMEHKPWSPLTEDHESND